MGKQLVYILSTQKVYVYCLHKCPNFVHKYLSQIARHNDKKSHPILAQTPALQKALLKFRLENTVKERVKEGTNSFREHTIT